MKNISPKPNLNTKKNYLDEVQSLIENNRIFGDIHFEYLDNLVKIFYPDINIYYLLKDEGKKEEINKILESIFLSINNREPSVELKETLYKLWDYLCEGDELTKADLVFVFGGISKLALEEAIKIKKEGYAPYILFSGKHASYVNGTEKTEAEQYRDIAIESGIPENEIIIENDSINTPENITKSKEVLKSFGTFPKSVIAVSLPYHMRRAYLTMWAGFDWEPKIIRHPGQSAKYSRDNYFKDIKGFSYIFYEYLKIYGARQMGHF